MLFSSCMSVVLSSSELLKQAVVLLPKNISHCILFEACRVRNVEAVQHIVSSWPHSEITFDFMSNGLCRRQRQLQPECIKPHEYFNVWYNLDELAEQIPFIAMGVFNGIHSSQQKNCKPVLSKVDLSKIRVTESPQLRALCKLIKGEFPVRHPSDYVSSTDKKAYLVSRPTLRATQTKISFILNVGITSRAMVLLFQEAVSNGVIFDITFSGIDMKSLEIFRQFGVFNFFNSPSYSNIILEPTLFDLGIYMHTCGVPRLQRGGCLCLNNTHASLSSTSYKALLSKVLCNLSSPISLVLTQYARDIFSALLLQPRVRLRAVRILPPHSPPLQVMTDSMDVLCAILDENEGDLEYLQLDCFSVTFAPLLSFQKCTNLRVLSLTPRKDKGILLKFMRSSVVCLFNALRKLQSLEYFEWCDDVNLVRQDLVSMKNVLTNSLPNLLHWHLRSCRIMLFASDLTSFDGDEVTKLHERLMRNKTVDESCETYLFAISNVHFINWLEIARPNVCFSCLKGAK